MPTLQIPQLQLLVGPASGADIIVRRTVLDIIVASRTGCRFHGAHGRGQPGSVFYNGGLAPREVKTAGEARHGVEASRRRLRLPPPKPDDALKARSTTVSMGIRFACPACGHILNIKSDLAGKRGICPKCQARVDIPLESTAARPARGSSQGPSPGSSPSLLNTAPAPEVAQAAHAPGAVLPAANADNAGPIWTPAAKPIIPAAAMPAAAPLAPAAPVPLPVPAAVPMPVPAPAPLPAPQAIPGFADPIAEAPHLLWYVAPPGSSNQYGPASAEMFRAWLHEGRVAADSMVWRQDWGAWQRAGDVLPQLGQSAPVVSLALGPSSQAPAGPIVGLDLDAIAAHNPEWSASQPAGAQSVLVGALDARQKKRSPINTTTVIIVLAILVVVLIPVVWLVLRH